MGALMSEKRHYLVVSTPSPQGLQLHARPYGEPYHGQEVWAYSPVEAMSIYANGELARPPVMPRTPREALLAIRGACREIHSETDPYQLAHDVERFVQDGLAPCQLDTFEWTDNLSDRLAEAIHLLTQVKETFEPKDPKADTVESPLTEKYPMLDVEIDSALALPPDIEAAIELRRPR